MELKWGTDFWNGKAALFLKKKKTLPNLTHHYCNQAWCIYREWIALAVLADALCWEQSRGNALLILEYLSGRFDAIVLAHGTVSHGSGAVFLWCLFLGRSQKVCSQTFSCYPMGSNRTPHILCVALTSVWNPLESLFINGMWNLCYVRNTQLFLFSVWIQEGCGGHHYMCLERWISFTFLCYSAVIFILWPMVLVLLLSLV